MKGEDEERKKTLSENNGIKKDIKKYYLKKKKSLEPEDSVLCVESLGLTGEGRGGQRGEFFLLKLYF